MASMRQIWRQMAQSSSCGPPRRTPSTARPPPTLQRALCGEPTQYPDLVCIRSSMQCARRTMLGSNNNLAPTRSTCVLLRQQVLDVMLQEHALALNTCKGSRDEGRQ